MKNQPQRARDAYNVEQWSEGLFAVNEGGDVAVCAHPELQIPLADVIEATRAAGLSLPTLLRFPSILHARVGALNDAFAVASEQQHYQGQFRSVYPIKVNQQQRVIEELIHGQKLAGQPIGLEAGSKPELMAVLALAGTMNTEQSVSPATIICNGYKDAHYIRLALLGEKLGHHVYIVVEKLSEAALILREAKALNVTPRLGVRARLSSIGKGNWQNTGGEKSKFGLSAGQLLQLVEYLKQEEALSSLQLLHFHLGSQIANIRDIQTGLRECGRIYAELCSIGCPMDVVDVGGGLGVDYEGTRSRNYCSTNYSMQEYANNVVQAFGQAADQQGLSHPTIVTESGRALTAHHAVLVTNVIDWEHAGDQTLLSPDAPPAADMHLVEPDPAAPTLLHDMWRIYQTIKQAPHRSLLEMYHDVVQDLSDGQNGFVHGAMSLKERAQAEACYTQICLLIRQGLNPSHRSHREVLDELNEKLADKLFVNFSLFQSVPDIWGINQIFPILPLTQLNKPVTRRAVIQDITCDSDGRVDQYVDGQGIESTLPMPSYGHAHDILMGFFMVGAYQEILGDMHNLFGDTDSVDVHIDKNGEIRLEHQQAGDSVASVLRYVNFDPDQLPALYEAQIRQAQLSHEDKALFLKELTTSLSAYTYLRH